MPANVGSRPHVRRGTEVAIAPLAVVDVASAGPIDGPIVASNMTTTTAVNPNRPVLVHHVDVTNATTFDLANAERN